MRRVLSTSTPRTRRLSPGCAGHRLRSFVENAARATRVGHVFDDAATGQGLLNSFLQAVQCGAITEEEAVEGSGLTLEELRGRSFARIVERQSR